MRLNSTPRKTWFRSRTGSRESTTHTYEMRVYFQVNSTGQALVSVFCDLSVDCVHSCSVTAVDLDLLSTF
jgi:hypothetical protein